jgi:hypothetical protein
MHYPMPKSEGTAMSWKHGAMIITAVVAVFSVSYFIVKAQDPSYDAERAEVLRVAYSHQDITNRVGTVSTASFVMKKKEGLALLSRVQAADWVRSRHKGVTKGSARVFVLGSRDAGYFVIHYTFVEKNGGFILESVDASAFDSPHEGRSSITDNSGAALRRL